MDPKLDSSADRYLDEIGRRIREQLKELAAAVVEAQGRDVVTDQELHLVARSALNAAYFWMDANWTR